MDGGKLIIKQTLDFRCETCLPAGRCETGVLGSERVENPSLRAQSAKQALPLLGTVHREASLVNGIQAALKTLVMPGTGFEIYLVMPVFINNLDYTRTVIPTKEVSAPLGFPGDALNVMMYVVDVLSNFEDQAYCLRETVIFSY